MKMPAPILVCLLLAMSGCRTQDVLSSCRLLMFNGLYTAEHPSREKDLVLVKTIKLNQPFNIDISVSGGHAYVNGMLTRRESGILHVAGTAGYNLVAGDLDREFRPGEYFSPEIMSCSGDVITPFVLIVEEI